MEKQEILKLLLSIWKNADLTDEEREALELVMKEYEK